MSIGAIKRYTTNFLFKIVNFSFPRWHSYEQSNWDALDSILSSYATQRGIKGVWTNSLVVAIGDRYIDTADGSVYLALVGHTTAASSTFAADRVARPTYWASDTVSNDSVTFAKLQNIATQTLIGRLTAGTGDPESLTFAQLLAGLNVNAHGQVRLTKSGANLALAPVDGGMLIINSKQCKLNTTLTLAPPATSGTLYYIYALDADADGVVDTLEASTTAYATDAMGIKYKTADASRTLVGMARTLSSAWVDTAAQRFVSSYFNRRNRHGLAFFTADRDITSATYAESNTEIRNEFLVWGDEAVHIAYSGSATNTSVVATNISIGIDGITAEDVMCRFTPSGASVVLPVGLSHNTLLSEGYHYATIITRSNTGTSRMVVASNAAGERSTLKTMTRG